MADLYKKFLEKYKSFTEIQKLSIPVIESGGNCLIIAPTGSGKTEAAVLPIINSMGSSDAPIKVLYITPLRALNRDMLRRLEDLCKQAHVTIGVRHGDTTQAERRKQVKMAPQLLITTPETLQSILPTKSIGPYLKNVKAVIIDELHELYHSKRGAQLSIALERLEELSNGFQRIGLSATIGDPNTVKGFLCNKRNCKVVKVGGVREMSLSVEAPKVPKERLEEFEEKFGLDSASVARLETISRFVSRSASSIIFANTRQVVESLGSRLLYLESIRPFGGIGVHHSSLDRNERVSIESKFKGGAIKSIIATSSLELGIDVGNIDLVIQYGSPRQALRLAQRVGRSGHTRKGVARGVVIATNPVEVLESCAIFERVRSGDFETFVPQFGALDVLANQICGIALDKGNLGIDELHDMLKRSFIYKGISIEELASTLRFMLKLRLIGFDGKRVTSGSRTRMYYYTHLSVIPDSKRFIVKSTVGNKAISSLDERFVVNNIEEGSTFITKGLPWKVLSIEKNVITVEPGTDLEAAIPDWIGEDIPVSRRIASGVFMLLGRKQGMRHKGFMTEESVRSLNAIIEKQKSSFVPSDDFLAIERLDEYTIIHTGMGTQANEAFSRLMAHMASTRLGKSVNVRASPYMIMLEVDRKFDVVGILRGISPKGLDAAMASALAGTELFRYRFITISKLFGIIEKDATVSRNFARRIIRVMKDTPIYEETFRELMRNYFDMATLAEFIGKLHSGKLEIRVFDEVNASAFTNAILNSAYYTKELITPITPNNELVESFSRFILSKAADFMCTYCGFRFSRKLEEIKNVEKIECPNCGSPMITFRNDRYEKAMKKKLGSKRLGKEDSAALKEMMVYSSLIESYGPKAAIALSVYGIGPRSAARALMMLRHDEREFFIDLIEAQRNFIKTKKYWSV